MNDGQGPPFPKRVVVLNPSEKAPRIMEMWQAKSHSGLGKKNGKPAKRKKKKTVKFLAPKTKIRELKSQLAVNTWQGPSTHIQSVDSQSAQQLMNHTRSNRCPYCNQTTSPKTSAKHFVNCRFVAERALARCPICNMSFLLIKLAAHMTRSHGVPYGTPGNLPIIVESVKAPTPVSAPKILVPCKECNAMVYSQAMEAHIKNCHSSEAELHRLLIGAHKFSFVLLPAAAGQLRVAIEMYRKCSSGHTRSLTDAVYDWERLERIESLDPIARYVGVKLWKGYVAFEFQHSSRVILECPRNGNATYILSGEWRKMISATKAELRSEYRHLSTRIIHTSDWEMRVRRAVFGPLRSGVLKFSGVYETPCKVVGGPHLKK